MTIGFLHTQRVPGSPTDQEAMFFPARMDHSPDVPSPTPGVPSPTPPFPEAPPELPTELPPDVNDPPVSPEHAPVQEPPSTPGQIIVGMARWT